MNLRGRLLALSRAIADECEHNAPFRRNVEDALGVSKAKERRPPTERKPSTRPHRRTPAVLDPVEIAKTGREALHGRLAGLDIEQLKDVVAQYGMDPSKLVMKWKDKDRIIDHIIETSLGRASKGDAFRT